MLKKGRRSFDAVIRSRINWVLMFFLAAALVLLARLFIIQIVNYREYVGLASKQHRLVKEISSERGSIFMQNKTGEFIPVAVNKTQRILASSPREVKDPKKAVEMLSSLLGISQEEIISKLSRKDDGYEIIAKKIGSDLADKIQQQKLPGIFLEEENQRFYPQGTTASRLLGFVSKNDENRQVGRYGLESFYEKELSGERGIFEGVKDAAGSWIALGKRIVHPPKNGSNVYLTVDYNIQLKAEEVLKKAREKWSAETGDVLVLEPQTGRILAMASLPGYDPNEFSKEKDYSVFINSVDEAMFEFGSVVKPLTMAAGLNENLIRPETTYEDPGIIQVSGFNIRNFDDKSHGLQTMTQVLEKSLNTGAVFVAKLLGPERQLAYLRKFGFGEKTGVDLPGEVPGSIANLNKGSEVDFYTAAFGQGVAATPLQMAMAMSAIANGGKLMKPYVAERIIDDAGNITENKPEIRREVISKNAAETLTRMLISVVVKGYDNRAGIKGYFVAGKTGTAQIPKKDGRGYSGQFLHSFIGYAPAFDPKFLILLRLQAPQGNIFAANTLPPYFKELAAFILNYYEVPPDEK